jgi:cytochrome c556
MQRISLSPARAAGLLAMLGLATLALPAVADVTVKNEDMAAIRQTIMRVNSSFGGMLEQQAKGTLAIPAAQLKQMGEAWLRMGKVMPSLFQKGSEGDSKSRAKPEIWSDAAGFKVQLDNYAAATTKFQQVAAAGGDKAAVDAAFAAVDKACDDCHKGFRTPAQR